jgi:hypothetical protein
MPPPPWQAPAVQSAPAGQARPQPPQLAESVLGSVQYIFPVGGSTQTTVGAWHIGEPAHAPLWQLVPAGQTLPQTPQLAGSLSRFAHQVLPVAVVQVPKPAPQDVSPPTVPIVVVELPPLPPLPVPPLPESHRPALHIAPAGQIRPQPPQLAGSLVKSAHQKAPVAD